MLFPFNSQGEFPGYALVIAILIFAADINKNRVIAFFCILGQAKTDTEILSAVCINIYLVTIFIKVVAVINILDSDGDLHIIQVHILISVFNLKVESNCISWLCIFSNLVIIV